jgi:DNA-directed RNA polymerase specialized sigma subunit
MREVKEKTPYHEFYMTHQAIADAFGNISRAGISQIEAQALQNFRKELAKRGYTMEDLLGGME